MATTKKKISPNKTTPAKFTAIQLLDKLTSLPLNSVASNSRFFKGDDKRNKILGARMSEVFKLSKEFTPMPLEEVENLLESDYYEARLAAVSIMDFQARDKKISPERRKQLYNLYTRRHDRINNWDLVDRSAPYVVGGYLFDKDRALLYNLAKSKNIWERRTAIVSTYYFIRQNDLDETFGIAEILVHDKQELINMAVGSWVREAGKRDTQKLIGFLDKYAATMPRVTLRYAIEKLDSEQKQMYMNAKK